MANILLFLLSPFVHLATIFHLSNRSLPTRHAKRNGRDSLHDDVLQEVQRRQLPAPLSVEGKGTSLLLRFKVAVPGPVLLGKTLHFGGGLFACNM